MRRLPGIVVLSFAAGVCALMVVGNVIAGWAGDDEGVFRSLLWLAAVGVISFVFGIPHFSRGLRMPNGRVWLGVSLILHLVGSLLQGYLVLHFWQGGDSLNAYHSSGIAYYQRPYEAFAHIQLDGTGAIKLLTILMYTLFGPSYYGMYIIAGFIAWVAIAILATSVQGGASTHWVKKLLLVLPSFWLWTGLFGKEPVVFLGMAVYYSGLVALRHGKSSKGLVQVALGLLLTSAIRPHVGLMLMAALAGAIVVSRGNTGTMARKIACVAIALIGAAVVLPVAQRTAGLDSLSLGAVANRVAAQNDLLQVGGSATGVSVASGSVASLLRSMPAVVALLAIGPMPSAAGAFGLGSWVESVFLFLLLLRDCKSMWRAIRRGNFFAWLAILYTLEFITILGPGLAANAGVLVRQRVMLWAILVPIVGQIRGMVGRSQPFTGAGEAATPSSRLPYTPAIWSSRSQHW